MPPSKRAGSGATKSQKKKKKPAQRIDSSDDEMEEATTGPKITKQPCFGAQYMLFPLPRDDARRGSRLFLTIRRQLAEEAVRGCQGGGKVGQMWH